MNESTQWGQTSLAAHNDKRIKHNLRQRDKLLRSLRAHLQGEDFVEVDTPTLRYYEDPTDNPPFVTLGPGGWPRLHLRTCPEEYTRRCACVFDKAFEIGKSFRNELLPLGGTLRTHMPEFTMAEIYQVDLDLAEALHCIENATRAAVIGIHRSGLVPYQGVELNFNAQFKRIKVLDALAQSDDPLAQEFVAKHRAAVPVLIVGEDRILHRLLDNCVKPTLEQPTFLTHFPKSADQLPDRFIGNEIQRAELVIAGIEIGEVGALQPDGNLLHQHATTAVQDRHGHAASNHLVDVDYLDEIKAFNRPVGGGAIGIDRLLMLLCNTKDLWEVVWYPFVGKFYTRR
ncbi:MAG: hypothetical protein HY273_14080 [Gammaproteobacteria bacterium]|nr:hypothetical protein [Gammaproteobacteria bacterium]